jgi:hypothetical protein
VFQSHGAGTTAIRSASYLDTQIETSAILHDGTHDCYLASDGFGNYIEPHSLLTCLGMLLSGKRFSFYIALHSAYTLLRPIFCFTWVGWRSRTHGLPASAPSFLLHTP